MKKLLVLSSVAVLTLSFVTPAFADEATSTDATSTPAVEATSTDIVIAPAAVSFGAGGHATTAQMQGLLSPAGYEVYLASKTTGGVQLADNPQTISILKHIIALLKQMIALK